MSGIGRIAGVAAVLAAATMGVLVACGGDDDASGTGAGQDGGTSLADGASADSAPPPTEMSACKAYIQAYCDRAAECGKPVAGCTTTEAYCPTYTFAPGSVRTIEGVIACAAVRRQQPCGDVLAGITPDCSPPGTLDAGAPCQFAAQCASFSCSAQGSCGTCAAPSTDGTCTPSCSGPSCVTCKINENCEPSGRCEPLVATPDLPENAACPGAGGLCSPPFQCRSASVDAGAGTCNAAGTVGGACLFDVFGRTGPCVNGHCVNSRCVDGLAGENEPCVTRLIGNDCQDPLVCDGAKCVKPLPTGAPCNNGEGVCARGTRCQSSRLADGGYGPVVCTPQKVLAALGEACTDDTDCAYNATCAPDSHVCRLDACPAPDGG